MKKLTLAQLRWTCPPSSLPFTTTKDVEPLNTIVGQDRAIAAIRLGAQIKSKGYNIWASGVVGTGRMTTIRQILDELKYEKPELFDIAYVHNFKQPEMPVLLRFHAGEGRVFKTMMDDALAVLRGRIPQLYDEEVFQKTRKEIIAEYQSKEQHLLKELDAKIRPTGFVVGQIQEEDGSVKTEIFPVIGDKPYTIDELDELVKAGTIKMEQVEKIRSEYLTHRDALNDLGRRSMRMMADFRKKLAKHDSNAVGILIKTVFDSVSKSFPRERVTNYLAGISKHVIEHLEEYVKAYALKDPEVNNEVSEEQSVAIDRLYAVNLVLDNYDTKTAPIIVETSPTYSTLFGSIEKRTDARGYAVSDFMHVKGGSVLRADGGYLVLNAVDVLADVNVWNALRRVMLYNRLDIQALDTQFSLNSIKPEWIKVNVKIILLGDPQYYLALWEADEDFPKMFKVHAEFDDIAPKTQEMITHYAGFFAKLAAEENLLHCDKQATAALIEWAVSYAENKEKITLQFSNVADLYREASHYARLKKARTVRKEHVDEALEQRMWRNNRVDERIRESIVRGTVLLDVTGERVGQINGLTVYSSGIVSFGSPARITATVSAGTAGIINIEREVEMSGSIHNKGVLILSGLLRALFSRSQPISFTASIAFEQNYGGVDGDSASSAETIALLSAISNIPIRQDLAITGSINQKGDIQPVGGLNEKITGFFEVCKDRGLTGTQGVVIPVQNVNDLMLSAEIVEAVRSKQFTIWHVRRIEEAVELMLNTPAGICDADGEYEAHTVFAKVQHNLNVLHEATRMWR